MKVHSLSKDREANDLYCTNPEALRLLLESESFSNNIWECCNGLGHLSNYLIDNGYNVRKSDIINYNNDNTEIIDMLNYSGNKFDGDIITNPPYKYSKEICEKCIESCTGKVAMYLPITFLASNKRKSFFKNHKPKTVYIMSKRLSCGKGGNFLKSGVIDYCWIVWDNSINVESTELKWI